ncbi:MAG: PP2C family protein-serine/threonine phosphatase, partial [bacterium]
MSEASFRIGDRLNEFLSRVRSREINKTQTLVYFLAWFISFLLIYLNIRLTFNLHFLFYVAHFYFWFKTAKDITQKFRPPNEILIACFFFLFLVEIPILRPVFDTSSFLTSSIPAPAAPLRFIQTVVLALLTIIFSLILVQNSRGKTATLAGYLFLGLLCFYLIERDTFLASLFLQIFLFIYLLRKTAWLEELTKLECWTALIVVYLALREFWGLNPFDGLRTNQFEDAFLWYILPKFWYVSFKIYLLAVLVKIPVVLVYNFASLSRKLRISSLFQSTFPQLIQLVMLLVIFYFFIAGWQAEKVRKVMFDQMDAIISGETVDGINFFTVTAGDFDSELRVKGHRPLRISDFDSLPPEGVISIEKEQSALGQFDSGTDHFLFVKDSEDRTLHLVKLDTKFLGLVSQETSILVGSQLLAYPYNPPPWEAFLINLGFWKNERSFRIVPFGLTRSRGSNVLAASFGREEEGSSAVIAKINEELRRRNPFTVGLVIAPLIENETQSGFFAFDILLVPSTSMMTWTLASYILLLGLIYLLANMLIIQRMSKFGSEINRMIVQKFNQLRNGIREIASGNLDYKVQVEGKDEFVELAERFNQMGDRLKESIAEVTEKERLQHELAIARKVQLDLLPKDLPEIPGFEIAATMKTANEVGGDFYDVIPLENDRFLLTIGDVSGKGTSAAFYMAQCISLIRYSPQFTEKPREIALRLNQYFADPRVDRQIFVTAVLALLDARSKAIQLVRAGHTLPILIPGKNGEKIAELEFEGLGIGLERGGEVFASHLKEKKISLQAGDALVLYTDGVVEAARSDLPADDNGEKSRYSFYSDDRLMTFL